MAYTPTDWQTGDVVTADKLNKLEIGVARGNGIISGAFNPETDEVIINKSFDDLTDMVADGTLPFLAVESDDDGLVLAPLLLLKYVDSSYMAAFGNKLQMVTFASSSSDTPMSASPETTPDPDDEIVK